MEKSLILSVVILMMINITDSVTNSIVGPSLIFYVTDMGGTKENYGLILSASYLSGMLMMTFYGAWVDSNGNKYKGPYAASFVLGIVGSFVYFFAVLFPKGTWAIGAILVGRFITGLGSAGRTMAYAWVATAIPRDKQRTILTILSMSRTFGMILGPLLNTLVARVHAEIVLPITDYVIPLNPYNSVGLILVLGESVLFVATALFLKDPPEKMERRMTKGGTPKKKLGYKEMLNTFRDFELLLCVGNFLSMMCSFTFFSVAIPPVASHMFGWTPVQISDVLAAQAVVLFLGMVTAMMLSLTKAPDLAMMVGGNVCFLVGGLFTYFWWVEDAAPWQFVTPIMIVSLSYPFIGPANRSKFTKSVHSRPELENSHGVMQSIFNQAVMIGGFISPNFTTAFILQSPEEIEQSGSSYELTNWAWLIPVSSLALIVGLMYEEFAHKGGKNELGFLSITEEEEGEPISAAIEEAPATEATSLMAGKRVSGRCRRRSSAVGKRRRSSIVEINQAFSTQYECDRRQSLEANGIINPFETRDEIILRNQLLEDKREWEELAKLDAMMEEQEEEAANME